MAKLNRRSFIQTSMASVGGLMLTPASAHADGTLAQKSPGQESPVPDDIVVLADYCLKTAYDNLPSAVVAITKNQILDTVGAALAGTNEPGAKEIREFTIDMAGKREAAIWGTNIQVPAQDAARVNAIMADALDYDDTYERSFLHPSVITVPAALAVTDMLGNVSGKDLIAATALGVDLACRLANSAQPGVDAFIVGWHNTSLYGYFASTFVAGKLMGLTRDQMVSALGIAFHQASGNSQAHLDGALTKRMGAGFASYAGVMAARLSKRGVQGAKNILEGPRGFYYQYHGNKYSRDFLFEGLGSTFAATDVSFKPWPSCRGSHTAVDAALTMFAENKIETSDVESITIYNGPGEYPLLDSPLSKKQNLTSVVDAQFSNPWIVTCALVDHKVGFEHFTTTAIKRPDLLAMVKRINTVEDQSLERPGGGPGATRLEVHLKDGRTFTKTSAYAKGGPKNPMSPIEFRQKFLDCTEKAGMSSAQAQALMVDIQQLETLPNAKKLTTAMVLKP
ncbi:MmgE/PrpD family protein [Paraburkholderia aromaticivorans]|uniref:MmgE/PrpD family protein n=1 Tax=Paraburkholderia aromaticivorans TaxID=2026199 RepID=UPI001F11011E|nr:MmgE/PrpD family protein [Paraburkholderia aromaticivorans]